MKAIRIFFNILTVLFFVFVFFYTIYFPGLSEDMQNKLIPSILFGVSTGSIFWSLMFVQYKIITNFNKWFNSKLKQDENISM
jgi:hypothetical protein